MNLPLDHLLGHKTKFLTIERKIDTAQFLKHIFAALELRRLPTDLKIQ